jgi:hypothetical protein
MYTSYHVAEMGFSNPEMEFMVKYSIPIACERGPQNGLKILEAPT